MRLIHSVKKAPEGWYLVFVMTAIISSRSELTLGGTAVPTHMLIINKNISEYKMEYSFIAIWKINTVVCVWGLCTAI